MTTHTDKRIDEALSTLMDHAPLAPEFPEPVHRPRRAPVVVASVVMLVAVAVGGIQLADADDDPTPVVASQPSAGPAAEDAVAAPPASEAAPPASEAAPPASEAAATSAIVVLAGSGRACEPAGLRDVIRELGVATVTTRDTSGAYDNPVIYTDPGFEDSAQRIADLFDPAAPVEPLAEAGTNPPVSFPEVDGTEPTVVIVLGPDCG